MNNDLAIRHCAPCTGATLPLSQQDTNAAMQQLNGWHLGNHSISKTFTFQNYYQTMAFVNAIAWMAHREDHHPELTVQFNTCQVSYTTHAINALSENDFICAAKVDALFKL